MKKVQKFVWDAVDWILYIDMIATVILVFVNVIGRYCFNHSLAIVDEAARILFVWMVYIGSIVAMKEMTHIRVDILLMFLPRLARKIVDIVANILVDCILLLTVRTTMNLVMENLTYPMPLTRIPYGVVQGIIPLSMLLMLIINLFHLVDLFRKQPENMEEGGKEA